MVDVGIAGEPEARAQAATSRRRTRYRELARSTWANATIAQRVTWAAIAAVVGVGIWFRTRGMFDGSISLWGDEALWALKLARDKGYDPLRPWGFMAVTHALTYALSWREGVLRFFPWLAGVATLLLALPLAKNLFRTDGARLVFISAFALSPACVDLGKEFKPYSLSLLVHVLGMLLALVYWNTRRERYLWLAGLWGVASLHFAQDVIFAYPAVFGVLGWAALRSGSRRALTLAIAATAASAAVVVLVYVLFWSRVDAGPRGSEAAYWAERYGVFYGGRGSRLRWLLDKQIGLAAFPGMRRMLWRDDYPGTAALVAWAWGLLHLAGLVALVVQRRGRDLALLLVPGAMVLVFNTLGYWPYGVFRTNLFLLVYATAIASAALDWSRPRWPLLAWAGWAVTLALLIAPLLAFERTWHAKKTTSEFVGRSAMRGAIRQLLSLKTRGEAGEEKERLVVSSPACLTFTYYTRLHPSYSKRREGLNAQFDVECLLREEPALYSAQKYLSRGGLQTWVLYNEGETLEMLQPELAERGLRVTRDYVMGGGDALLIRVEPARGLRLEPARGRRRR